MKTIKNKSQNHQAAKLSTEAVNTPIPVYDNPIIRNAKATQGQILNGSIDKTISKAHKDYDTDLARDNLENDNTAADIQDL